MIEIAFWNTHKKTSNVAQALRHSREVDIWAIQEPMGKPGEIPPCPSTAKYWRVFQGGRAAIYVHKRYAAAATKHDAGEDWARVTFGEGDDSLHIWSIYSQPQSGTRWISPITDFADRPQRGRHILVGDFNLKHPLWDIYERYEKQSDDLLAFAQRWNLVLATPKGEITRKQHGHRDSTIDLAWASQDIPVTYLGDLDLTGSDHKAQLLQVAHGAEAREAERATATGWNWPMMSKELVGAVAQTTLRDIGDPTSPEELEEACGNLISNLTEIADNTVPRRKPSAGKGCDWWCHETKAATAKAKQLERRYDETRTASAWRNLQQGISAQDRAIHKAQSRSWRRALAKASRDPKALWKIEKWARLRSWQPPVAAKLPHLRRHEDAPITARTHSEKARILADQFFPDPEADLRDIPPGLEWIGTPRDKHITISQEIDHSDIAELLRNVGSWKAPGEDQLANGFLKACGKPLAKQLAKLATASMRLAYYPQRFRCATVVVIPKPGKTARTRETASGWRPISLINTVGKVIELAITKRLSDAAEAHNLLPEMQMGNRRERSTELAIRVVVDAAQEALQSNAIASLLQLDFSGAFDRVNKRRLLWTLHQKGLPTWLILWINNFMSDRTSRLLFDGGASAPLPIRAGVPQGSPLSPVLFLLYIATLYEELQKATGILVVGYADDTNLMSTARDARENCRRFEKAWKICLSWAERHGMKFNTTKTELIHFSRARAACTECVRLGDATIEPVEKARFLGVWTDRKLNWSAHKEAILRKMKTQMLALTRLAASAWGVSLVRARHTYIAVIRSVLSFGAAAWHTPNTKTKPTGLARCFSAEQNKCLRTVAGAYKSTPIRQLETELNILPLDIYLDKTVANFEGRIDATGKTLILDKTRRAVRSALRRPYRGPTRGRPRRETAAPTHPSIKKAEWTMNWRDDDDPEVVAHRKWTERWENEAISRRRRSELADTPPALEAFEKYRGLLKHEASLLFQLRTGRIGLNASLFLRRVPDVPTPLCSCAQNLETPEHIILYCPLYDAERQRLRDDLAPLPLRTRRDLATITEDPTTARMLVQRTLETGRFTYYHLAKRIGGMRERLKRDRSQYANAAQQHNSIEVTDETHVQELLHYGSLQGDSQRITEEITQSVRDAP